ncbi:MAG TPA: hypothetical protein VMW17_05550 [Candidatus Binatia bacterium]|nr:hypothetical protein [Candidatus Binatia bacterium]
MKIKIVEPRTLGLMAHHAGKQFEAERIEGGYRLIVWKRSRTQPRITDHEVANGHVEIVEEIDCDAIAQLLAFSWVP